MTTREECLATCIELMKAGLSLGCAVLRARPIWLPLNEIPANSLFIHALDRTLRVVEAQPEPNGVLTNIPETPKSGLRRRTLSIMLALSTIVMHSFFAWPFLTPDVPSSPPDVYLIVFMPHLYMAYFLGADALRNGSFSIAAAWWDIIVSVPCSLFYGIMITVALSQVARMFGRKSISSI